MTNDELDRLAIETDRKNALAPVVYIVDLHGPLAKALEAYARSEEVSAVVVIREAVRAYMGESIR